MAKKAAGRKSKASDDFTADLIKSLNKDHGSRIAYNLSVDESPTHVKAWVSTGIRQLDYIVANRKGGGLPCGRIVEIFGPPSIGKSHIALQIARNTQAMGGIVVYIDTENGTSVENLGLLGIDVSKRFVFIETACTEEVFAVAESTITKARGLNKKVPITIVWDSVAASSPKAELTGDYDKDTIGLQARSISRGMRKITQVIGNTNPVAGPFFNFSVPEPTGVVAAVAPQDASVLGLVSVVAPIIVTGNAVIIMPSSSRPIPAITLAECLATSDVPAGVVNILTGAPAEAMPWLAEHADVNALDLTGIVDEGVAADLERSAAGTVKRVRGAAPHADWQATPSLSLIRAFVEVKTVWHPMGV